MKTFVTFLTFLTIVLPLYIISQPSWERVTQLPQENDLNDIIKIPGTNKLIATGGGSTVMISNNSGETWHIQYHPSGMDNKYAGECLYFLNSNIGFLGGSFYSILKTTDSGINWGLVDSTNSIYYTDRIEDIEFISETTGFAVGDHTTIKKTTDGGDTWISIEAGNDFNLHHVEFCDESIGFIVGYSNENILKTIDGGNSWQIINNPAGLEDIGIYDLKFVNDTTGFLYGSTGSPNNQGVICKTINKGITWSVLYSEASAYTGALDFIDDQHGIIGYATWGYASKILLTENGGSDWSEIDLPGFSWHGTHSVCLMNNDIALSVGELGQVYKSSNGGSDWETLQNRTFYGDIYQLQFLDQNTGFALAKSHTGGMAVSDLKKTTDGGLNWEECGGYWNYNGAFYFANEYLGFLTYRDFGLQLGKTTNGGVNWSQIETGFDFEPQDIKFYGTNTGLIVGEYQIIKTTDSGISWEEVFYLPTLWPNFYDIEFVSEDDIFIVGADENFASTAIYKSNDGGNFWEVDSLGNYWAARDLFFVDDNIAFIVCENNTILKSVDGAETWTETVIDSQYPISFRSIYFPSNDIGYAVGEGSFETIVKTIDGGDTWFVINSGTTSRLTGVYFSDEENGLVAGGGGVILKTENGGITGFDEPKFASSNSKFKVYPNPFSSEVNIEMSCTEKWSNITIFIFDQSGKPVKNYIVNRGSSNFTISTDELTTGIYYCHLLTDSGYQETKKLIKLKN